MNGVRRGATTGAAMLWRPGADFGPTWPEVERLVLQNRSQKIKQKNTFAGKYPKGVEWKMGALSAHDFYKYIEVAKN